MTYDVIIVGGGLSGLSLACLLGRIEGLRVACLDRDDPEAALAADERTTAISYGSSQILQRAYVWEQIVAQGCPIQDIEILDGDSPLLLQFLSRDVQDKAFGWIIANAHIRRCLMDCIAGLDGVDHLTSVTAQDFAVSDDTASVTLHNGQVLEASLIIGADGRGSAVRGFMDVDIRQWDYKQQAVVCFIHHENPHQHKAVEHFWPQGPFAILPMADDENGRHRSSLVFTEHKARNPKDSLMALDDAGFAAQVQSLFPAFYGAIEIIDHKRMAYPLSLIHAAEYVAPRMALVADAAHGIHPIAGQGLNLGFRDLNEITSLIADAFAAGQDIGGRDVLQTYQRRRRPDNTTMIAVTDGLVRLFSNDLKSVKMLRRFGLKAVSKIPVAKRFFMHRAMGE